MGNKNTIRISFIGDVVPGGVLCYFRGKQAVDNEIRKLLVGSDLVVATLESPFGDGSVISPEKKNIIFSQVEDFFRLKELNVGVVSIANNHILDLTEAGLDHTLRLLDSHGILHCGAGRNIGEARTPAIVEANGLRIGFLAYCKSNYPFMGKVHVADEHRPGVAPLEPELIVDDIKKVRPSCDLLYLILHWGIEYTWLPTPENIRLASNLLASGADGIIGGHPHRVQPFRQKMGKPVFFSLGNFMFPNIVMTPPKTMAYPEECTSGNYQHLPTITNYREVSETTLHIWPRLSRIGMIVTIEAGISTQRMKVYFTRSEKFNSSLTMMKGWFPQCLKIFLKLVGWGIRLPVYRFIFHRILKLH